MKKDFEQSQEVLELFCTLQYKEYIFWVMGVPLLFSKRLIRLKHNIAQQSLSFEAELHVKLIQGLG